MADHFPGPWTVAKSGVSIDAGPTRIRMERAGELEQLQATARLIAASPELLAALEGLVEDLDEMSHTGIDEERHAARMEAARAAIARARGPRA